MACASQQWWTARQLCSSTVEVFVIMQTVWTTVYWQQETQDQQATQSGSVAEWVLHVLLDRISRKYVVRTWLFNIIITMAQPSLQPTPRHIGLMTSWWARPNYWFNMELILACWSNTFIAKARKSLRTIYTLYNLRPKMTFWGNCIPLFWIFIEYLLMLRVVCYTVIMVGWVNDKSYASIGCSL